MTSEMWLCLFDERFELVFGSPECAKSECCLGGARELMNEGGDQVKTLTGRASVIVRS